MRDFFKAKNFPKIRRISQIFSFFVIDGYWGVIKNPSFYQGPLKGITLPVMNCYSCPLSYTSCPIGLLQHFLELRLIPYYVLGVITAVGSVFGRASCGWVCPFGLFQDLMYKIPTKKFRIPHFLYYLKYAFLIITIVLAAWIVSPVFCKYFCPVGTFEAGIPQILWNPSYKQLLTWIFWTKLSIMFIFLGLFVFTKRPFCTTSCPMGALLGPFNKISFLQMNVNSYKCVECDLCRTVCPMDISIWKNPTDMDCIRCGKCVAACPTNAITMSFKNVKVNNNLDTKPIFKKNV